MGDQTDIEEITAGEEHSSDSRDQLTPDLILKAYLHGIFPMAESAEDKSIFWVDPDLRGILPLDAFHIPRSLKKTLRKQPFEVRINHNFRGVLDACAETSVYGDSRQETWINDTIKGLYTDLHHTGWAHSVECWQNNKLVGGLYGLAIGGAFFGESMFHRATDASKIALVYLIARLRAGGFSLLDTQFVTDHLAQFGTREIPRKEYHARLRAAVTAQSNWLSLPVKASPDAVLQAITQTS